MAFYQIEKTQIIPAEITEIWNFISSPVNLKHITPPYLGFEIINNNLPGKMYPGMIISYKVSPLLGIKMKWVTEITYVKENEYFIDEQRIGPYSMWHHQHKITPIDSGVLMTDIVTYNPPFGFLGALSNKVFIRKQLDEIFNYRKSAIERKFGVS
ncbi:MAG: SRPBCC family protein [Ignavibacteriaceae bacterium]